MADIEIEMMSADELRSLLRATPFLPFTVYLPSEKSFSVRHPEFAVLTPPGRTMIVLHAEDNGFDLLEVPLIARVEIHDSKSSGS